MKTWQTFSGLLAGLVFGLGLAVSGLANPDKVLQFLRLDQNWSPVLLVTMFSGIVVTLVGYRLVLNGKPLFEAEFQLPTHQKVDRRLLAGALIFGVGWGIAGFCPGPVLTALGSWNLEPWIFLAAMLAGFKLKDLMV